MNASASGDFLEIVDLHKSYGTVEVLKGVSIAARQGEFISLVGPSGCGKTTTLNIVGGFEQPSSGDVRLGGRSMLPLPSHKRGLGMVFQNHALLPHLTVEQNVGFGLAMTRVPKPEIARRAREALRLVRLEGFEARYPRELSGGQQQRVGIARALTVNPKVLLMDEPLSSLDAKLRREMQLELRRIQQSVGITALYVTHDQEEALSLSDRIVLMNKGRIEQAGSPTELYRQPLTEFVAGFIGESSFLDGVLREIRGAEAQIEIATGERIAVATPVGGAVGGKVRLGIRPDRLRLSRDPASGDGLKAVVVASAFVGSLQRVMVRLADGVEMKASIDASSALPQIDDALVMSASAHDWMVFPEGGA
ncbi:MAG: ABC transporter ATP-binding protein [Rhizobiales bacterium]|nr:ABC transporter ATP-binding protein [Hyphomicrobiales bacterium]